MSLCLFSALGGEDQEFKVREAISDSLIYILPHGMTLGKALRMCELSFALSINRNVCYQG